MSHHNPTSRKNFTIIHRVAVVLLTLMLALGAYTKLAGHPDAIALFTRLNLLPFMKAFGLIQLIIIFCLWWKPLRILGTLLASAYFGAGVVMMLSLDESAVMSSILLLLTWIIHKCTWWSMWNHGYHCGCSDCMANVGVLPKDKKYCDCNKPGCRCEHGKCDC